MTLGGIGRDPRTGGMDRTAFSAADMAARTWYRSQLEEAGMEVRIDPAGNLIGRMVGSDASLPAIVLGSHLDTVPQGGRFDGATGMVAALEVVRTLQDLGVRLLHTLEIVDFVDEEGGLVGSRAWIGTLTPEEMRKEYGGLDLAGQLTALGLDPDRVGEAQRASGEIAAYIELHVEQGRTMESRGLQVGIVEGIVALDEYRITVDGEANHAGTTRMADRRDPMAAAARMIIAVQDEVRRQGGSLVATVGRIEAEPGAPNVIPARVRFTLDIRDPSRIVLERALSELQSAFTRIAEESGVTQAWEPMVQLPPAPCDPGIMQVLQRAADLYGYPNAVLPSGAGHDAQSVARIAPIGMIFVPSMGGLSHTPMEFTRTEDIAAGTDVLLQSILILDQRGP